MHEGVVGEGGKKEAEAVLIPRHLGEVLGVGDRRGTVSAGDNFVGGRF